MHKPAMVQNGLANILTGVFKALKPTRWLAGIAAPFALALAALLIAGMAQASLPGLAEANHGIQIPSKPSGSSSGGVMTVTWGDTHGATSGYQYRYSTSSLCLLAATGCDFGGTDQDWTNHGSGSSSTTLELNNRPTGHTYFFQVRGRDDIDTGEASEVSSGVFHNLGTVPTKLANVTATAGHDEETQDPQVTLRWDVPPAADNVINYSLRQSDPNNPWTEDSWVDIVTTESETTGIKYVVTGLTNGVTYSFQVRANNLIGGSPDSETVTATPSGPPTAPDLSATPGDEKVLLYWTDLGDSTITKFQYRKRITTEGADAWDPNWKDMLNDNGTPDDDSDDFLVTGTSTQSTVKSEG